MLHIKRSHAAIVAAFTLAAIAALFVVPALAKIPDAHGIIHACYDPTGGSLNVVDSGKHQTCSAAQKKLNWSASNIPNEYIAQSVNGVIIQSSQGDWVTEVEVPAGDYSVDLAFSPSTARCNVSIPDNPSGFYGTPVPGGALNIQVHVATAEEMAMFCVNEDAGAEQFRGSLYAHPVVPVVSSNDFNGSAK